MNEEKQGALKALDHLWGAVPDERKAGWKASYVALNNYIELSVPAYTAGDGPAATDDGAEVPLPGTENSDQGATPDTEEDL